MIDIDEDAFYISSWAEYAQACYEANKMQLFREKLASYIRVTNKPIKDGLKAYANRRMGEWARDELEARYAEKFREKA